MKPKTAPLTRPESTSSGGQEVDGGVDVGAGGEVEAGDADEETAKDSNDIAHGCQGRHGDGGSEQARGDEVFHRVGREGGQGVDLFGDAHGAKFRGDRGGDAAGDHEAAEDGAQLAGYRNGDDIGDHGFGVETLSPPA